MLSSRAARFVMRQTRAVSSLTDANTRHFTKSHGFRASLKNYVSNRSAGRVAKSTVQVTKEDVAVYPLLACMAGAVVLVGGASMRYLVYSPDVHFDKENRAKTVYDNEEESVAWSAGIRKWLRGDKPVDQIRIPPFKH